MMPGLFASEWSVAEQRRQELLDEAAAIRLIRNAREGNAQPARHSQRFRIGSILDKVLQVIGHAFAQPMGLGPRGFRDGLL